MVDLLLGLLFGKSGTIYYVDFQGSLGVCITIYRGPEQWYTFPQLCSPSRHLCLWGEDGEGREKPAKPWGVSEGLVRWMWNLLDRDKTEATGLECERQRQGQ